MRLIALIVFALLCFASNSLLTRAGIGGQHMDAWTFMLVRLGTGALALWTLVRLRRTPARGRGSWFMAAALGAYAVFFTLAYVRLTAGPGALVLFGSVQLTMFATALGRGERLTWLHGAGVLLALAGFLVLTLPGLSAPDPVGAVLMAGAGICWAAYTVAGRGSTDPLAVTADNFIRASAIAIPVVLLVGVHGPYSVAGFAYAAASGAVASGLGYAAWYSIVPAIPVWRAATLQLSVPLLTAIGASAILREPVSARLTGALALITLGIALTNAKRRPSR